MNFKSIDDLIKKLSSKDKIEATKELTKFYADARFKIDNSTFNLQYVDGRDDGGIDFYHLEGTDAFYIFQTKFVSRSQNANEEEIMHEINKLKNTLSGENLNKRAEEFVNVVKREAKNRQAILEIVFITTKKIAPDLQDKIQKNIDNWKKQKIWLTMEVKFLYFQGWN